MKEDEERRYNTKISAIEMKYGLIHHQSINKVICWDNFFFAGSYYSSLSYDQYKPLEGIFKKIIIEANKEGITGDYLINARYSKDLKTNCITISGIMASAK